MNMGPPIIDLPAHLICSLQYSISINTVEAEDSNPNSPHNGIVNRRLLSELFSTCLYDVDISLQ